MRAFWRFLINFYEIRDSEKVGINPLPTLQLLEDINMTVKMDARNVRKHSD
jgi:hypothetical protein